MGLLSLQTSLFSPNFPTGPRPYLSDDLFRFLRGRGSVGKFLDCRAALLAIKNAPFVRVDKWGVVYFGSFPLSNICICSAGACGGR